MVKINPYVVLATAVVGVSVSAIFVKYTTAPPTVTAFYRLLFTFMLTLPLTLGTKKYQWRKITKKQLAAIFLSALFLSLHFISWFASLSYTSVASSTVLVNTQPFFVILFGYILWRQPIAKSSLLSVGLALVGTLILSWGDFSLGGTSLWGDCLALIGAVFIAIHYLFTSYLRHQMDTIAYTSLLYGFATLILALAVPLGGYGFTGYMPRDYLVFFCLALFCTILGHTLFSWCMKYLSVSAVSLSVLGEPVIAAGIAFFLLGEDFSQSQLIGSLLVLISIYGYLRGENKKALATHPEDGSAQKKSFPS